MFFYNYIGKGLPRVAKNGDELPNARLISQAIMDEDLGPPIQGDKIRSAQVVSHGQLVAHDIIKTNIPCKNLIILGSMSFISLSLATRNTYHQISLSLNINSSE